MVGAGMSADHLEPPPRAAELRIAPGSRSEIGLVNASLARAIGLATGGPPPHIFTTLGRHRRLFRRWLRFAGALMPGGTLPRADTELLILRTAFNCGCTYEWRHHERIATGEGLSTADVARVAEGPGAAGWTERRAALLGAADELYERSVVSDATWSQLRAELSDQELIEVCMLVGHYEMLAMTLNSLGVQPDALGGTGLSRAARTARGLLSRRSSH